jgi:bifunctional N-acetylglucosamine-1-phosphate-uridyltransferase/glucosamine-1-phosphate-acetyltransferase GlmU-like protein
MKILTFEEVHRSCGVGLDPSLWTVVIPAAGKGTRLGYSKPKILYPIAGKTILDRMIDLLSPFCANFKFVFSPLNASYAAHIVEDRLGSRGKSLVIENSKGMADSIYRAIPEITTPYTLIIWGDQPAILPETIRALMEIKQSYEETTLVLPLVSRENPYVHYESNEAGCFIRVLQRREGDMMPSIGESDCGVFAFNTKELQGVFRQEIEKGISLSQVTKEWNFLPLLPQFDTNSEAVKALRLDSLEQTIGVNDAQDVAILEKYFNELSVK